MRPDITGCTPLPDADAIGVPEHLRELYEDLSDSQIARHEFHDADDAAELAEFLATWANGEAAERAHDQLDRIADSIADVARVFGRVEKLIDDYLPMLEAIGGMAPVLGMLQGGK